MSEQTLPFHRYPLFCCSRPLTNACPSRLLELLLDINDSPQIPPERRFDLNANEEDDTEEEEEEEEEDPSKPTKSLKRLVKDVPHYSFAEFVEMYPEALDQLQHQDPELYPSAFLTADDVDNYLAEVDSRLKLTTKPTVPPSTPDPDMAAANFAMRNPTSVYNWLRRHAPKTFLQDLEKEKDKDKDRDHDDGGKERGGGGGKRKSGVSRGSKKQSSARHEGAGEGKEWEEETQGYDDQPFGSVRGKRKRDDDGGYRPKGGASRPVKKRARKSGA